MIAPTIKRFHQKGERVFNCMAKEFYAHLGSKDAAFAAALEHGLEEVIEAVPAYQRKHGDKWAEAFSNYHLGKPHREDLECGCAMTTLSSEVVRAGPDIHLLYEKLMTTRRRAPLLNMVNGT